MKLLTIQTESRMGTLWDQEQCEQFCSKEELWETAREKETKIPWKEANEADWTQQLNPKLNPKLKSS